MHLSSNWLITGERDQNKSIQIERFSCKQGRIIHLSLNIL